MIYKESKEKKWIYLPRFRVEEKKKFFFCEATKKLVDGYKEEKMN